MTVRHHDECEYNPTGYFTQLGPKYSQLDRAEAFEIQRKKKITYTVREVAERYLVATCTVRQWMNKGINGFRLLHFFEDGKAKVTLYDLEKFQVHREWAARKRESGNQ